MINNYTNYNTLFLRFFDLIDYTSHPPHIIHETWFHSRNQEEPTDVYP
jgi:hypothetical protein